MNVSPRHGMHESFSAAQQHADVLAMPPPLWNRPQAQRHRSRRAVMIGLASLLAVSSGAVAYVKWAKPFRGGDAIDVDATLREAPPGAGEQPTPPWATVVRPRVAQPPPAPVRAGPLTMAVRGAGLITIQFADTTLGDAVTALARASETTVHGGSALPLSQRVNLHWRGSSAAEAWDQLVGRYANTAISCNSATCEVWIVGAKPLPPGGMSASPSVATASSLVTGSTTQQAAVGMVQGPPSTAPAAVASSRPNAPVEQPEDN